MKKILMLCLLCLALCQTEDFDYKNSSDLGPAANPKHDQSTYTCSYENKDPAASYAEGTSDCVDRILWEPDNKRYYDRCCYIRYQLRGKMYGECIALTEEQYLDTTETIRRFEEGDKTIGTVKFKYSKIYQFDCNSSYIKVLSFATFLLALIL